MGRVRKVQRAWAGTIIATPEAGKLVDDKYVADPELRAERITSGLGLN